MDQRMLPIHSSLNSASLGRAASAMTLICDQPDIPRVDNDHAVIIRLCGLNSSIL